jgi:hypothetical protein
MKNQLRRSYILIETTRKKWRRAPQERRYPGKAPRLFSMHQNRCADVLKDFAPTERGGDSKSL